MVYWFYWWNGLLESLLVVQWGLVGLDINIKPPILGSFWGLQSSRVDRYSEEFMVILSRPCNPLNHDEFRECRVCLWLFGPRHVLCRHEQCQSFGWSMYSNLLMSTQAGPFDLCSQFGRVLNLKCFLDSWPSSFYCIMLLLWLILAPAKVLLASLFCSKSWTCPKQTLTPCKCVLTKCVFSWLFGVTRRRNLMHGDQTPAMKHQKSLTDAWNA